MTWSLAEAKARLNITDTSKDAQIQQTLDLATAIVEGHLNRGVVRRNMQVAFRRLYGRQMHLPRYPIIKINSITLEGGGTLYEPVVHYALGIIDHPGIHLQPNIYVDYEGGYDPLPVDLAWGMWSVFDTLWGEAGGASGGGTTGPVVVQGSGEIKSIQIYDVGRIDYDVGATVASGGGTTDHSSVSAILEPSDRLAAVFNRYSRTVGVM